MFFCVTICKRCSCECGIGKYNTHPMNKVIKVWASGQTCSFFDVCCIFHIKPQNTNTTSCETVCFALNSQDLHHWLLELPRKGRKNNVAIFILCGTVNKVLHFYLQTDVAAIILILVKQKIIIWCWRNSGNCRLLSLELARQHLSASYWEGNVLHPNKTRQTVRYVWW